LIEAVRCGSRLIIGDGAAESLSGDRTPRGFGSRKVSPSGIYDEGENGCSGSTGSIHLEVVSASRSVIPFSARVMNGERRPDHQPDKANVRWTDRSVLIESIR
jgi:hypothetical protein